MILWELLLIAVVFVGALGIVLGLVFLAAAIYEAIKTWLLYG